MATFDYGEKRSGIYSLKINGQCYIGSAVCLGKRLRSHWDTLRKNTHRNIHLQRAFNKYQDFNFEVLEFVENKELLIKREQYYMDLLAPKYNISPTAGSQMGFRHSEASKLKISQIQKGKKLSQETCAKMSESKKGWSPTPEQRLNYRASKLGDKNPFYRAGKKHPQYGIPKSDITKRKISQAAKLSKKHAGANNSSAKSGVLYDVVTGENYIFQSLRPLCKELGLNHQSAYGAYYGKRFLNDRFYIDYVSIPKHIYTRIGAIV